MNFDRSWHLPPDNLILGSDEVHVWLASLNQTAETIQNLRQILSADEEKRAERFYFPRHREHFIVARGLLRTILGLYLDKEPQTLSFSYNSYGKPSLIPEQGGDNLRFNLSHSHELALYAVTRNRDIGVDIERISTERSCEEIAERFFSPLEKATLRSLPANIKHQAFFNCWTRKEAFIKATGKGLSLPLDQFDVTVAPGEPAALLSTQWEPQEASRWSLQELTVSPDYAASLAVEGHGWRLKCWQFPS